MAKLLLNADGKVLTSNAKVLKAPEVEDTLGQLLSNNITSYSNSSITKISTRYTFYQNTLLESIDLPNLTDAWSSMYMFSDCTKLKLVNLPKLEKTGSYMFKGCSALESIDLPNVTKMNQETFNGCTSLKNINMPNIKDLGSFTFNGCTLLEPFNLSNIVSLGAGPFAKVKWTNFELTNLASASIQMFQQCYDAISIKLPKLTSILMYTFSECYSLKKIYLGYNGALIPLKNTNAFEKCYHILGTPNDTYNPNGDKDGYIQVPASRLANYKVATNWIEYASQIIGHQDFNVGDTLPDYTNETFTTQTWYSDETLTTVVTSVATAGKYYCRLEE